MYMLDVVVYNFNPTTWEAEAVRGKPHLHSELQNNQDYLMSSFLKRNKLPQKTSIYENIIIQLFHVLT